MTVNALVEIQHHTRSVLTEFLSPGQSVAVLDFPNHENAGDVLIYEGQLRYLSQLGCEVSYVCSWHTYDREVLNRLHPAGPILLQGGGNFGDRYPMYQDFRERVVLDFPDREIIQLPQTMDYLDSERLRQTQRIYSGHPGLTILVRDQRSVETVEAVFPNNRVMFCPDMAFGFGRAAGANTGDYSVVLMKRTDAESVQKHGDIPEPL